MKISELIEVLKQLEEIGLGNIDIDVFLDDDAPMVSLEVKKDVSIYVDERFKFDAFESRSCKLTGSLTDPADIEKLKELLK